MAAILIVGGIVYIEHLNNVQLADLQSKFDSLQKVATSLENDKASLEKDNATLRETAASYYKRGVELQSSNDLSAAKDAFAAVVSEFPTSNLVKLATQRIAELEGAIAKAQTEALEEETRNQAEQARQTREQGEPIDYGSFRAKVLSTGVPNGKRFRFTAAVDLAWLNEPQGDFTTMLGYVPAFDDEMQHEGFIRGDNSHPHTRTVVASVGADGRIHVHRIE